MPKGTLNIINQVVKFTKVYLLMLVIIAVSAILYFSWSDSRTTIKVKEINDTPYHYYEMDQINTSVLPAEKLYRKYRYIFTSPSSRLHTQSYLAFHPTDAVEKSYLDDGEYSLTVFSNKPPDLKFFKVKD